MNNNLINYIFDKNGGWKSAFSMVQYLWKRVWLYEDNNKYIEKYEKRIKRLQRELSRKKKRSNNYYKCKHKLAILYSKLSNARNNYLHKITKYITREYDVIVCEWLKTKNMIMNKVLSKNITDATFGEILRKLEYKSKYKCKYFYKIDTYYSSS